MYRRSIKLGLSVLSLSIVGCSQLPHNNVLLFGTETKVGLDASTNPANGGTPQVTFGYKRSEAAWLPLAANRFTCQGDNCSVQTGVSKDGKTEMFQATSTTLDSKGKPLVSTDAYSVFGSFGATFEGSSTVTQATAKGGLAQFFATGIAAQDLAKNTRVVEALKVEDPAGTVQREKAVEADANARLEEAKTQRVALVSGIKTEQDKISECVTTDGKLDEAKLVTLTNAAAASDDSFLSAPVLMSEVLASADISALESTLSRSALRTPMAEASGNPENCKASEES